MNAGRLACSIVLAFTAVSLQATPFRTIQRIWATAPEKIEAARAAYPGAFSDGIIIATFVGLKSGPDEVKDFGKQKAFIERMRASGVEVQIAISSTIGHNDAWTVENPYPKMTGANGIRAKTIACPRSAEFKEYLRTVFRRYAELRPKVMWVDDDFRMPFHRPVDFGCFCENCLEAFASESGVRLDRKGMVDAILSDRSVNGVRVRSAWRTFTQSSQTELVGVISDAVHSVDNGIIIGFMCCNPYGIAYAPFDFKSWIGRARNRDGIVWFRHGSGAYNDFTPYAEEGIVGKNVAIGRNCAMTEGDGVVNLTEEVTLPYNRRAKSLKMTFLEAALNVGFAGADGVTYDAIKPNLDEQLRPDAVVADIHRRRGELDRMRALTEGKRQIGVYPFYDQDIWLANGREKSLGKMRMLDVEAWKHLIYTGIPFTFRERDASLLLLSGKAAGSMPQDRLSAWRKRGIIADRTAADTVGECGKTFVFGKGTWSRDVLGRKESLEIKDALDRLAGGRMPSRVDTCVRLAQSVWESPDGNERVVFLFNLDYDDSTDARLALDGRYRAEVLDAASGVFSAIGEGDAFRLPTVPAWSPLVLRLKKIR